MRTEMAAWALVAALAAGCASEVRRQPVEMTAGVPEAGQRFVTGAAVEAVPDSGYRRTIAAGTEFVVVGRIAQGLVLKPTQTVLTLEGAHMHEAYAVHRDGMFVGFYLPVERAYSALSKPVSMPLQERKTP
jgi:hypothetical protein